MKDHTLKQVFFTISGSILLIAGDILNATTVQAGGFILIGLVFFYVLIDDWITKKGETNENNKAC